MRGSPPTMRFSGGSLSVGNIGQSLPGIVSVSGGVTPETMTGLPTLAPVISGQPRLHSDSPGRGIVEGCLLTPGTRPNSLPQPQVLMGTTEQNGCDNTPLGDPGRARGQPEVKAASPEPAMAMVWAVGGEAADAAEGGGAVVAKWHAMVTVMQHKLVKWRKIWALRRVKAERMDEGRGPGLVKPQLGSAEWTSSGVSKSGVPKVDRQFEEKLVEMNRNSRVNGQHNYCAILGAPIGVPKIELQADIGAVEPDRAVKADVQKTCGAILSTPAGVPKIYQRAENSTDVQSSASMEASLRVVREGPDGLAKREAAHWITMVKEAWAKQGAMRSAVKDWLWRMGRNKQQRVAELTYDRVYTSPAGVRTACKLLSVRQGAAQVQFIDGVASVKAQSLTHRQCDGEMGARKESMHARERAEAAAGIQCAGENLVTYYYIWPESDFSQKNY